MIYNISYNYYLYLSNDESTVPEKWDNICRNVSLTFEKVKQQRKFAKVL